MAGDQYGRETSFLAGSCEIFTGPGDSQCFFFSLRIALFDCRECPGGIHDWPPVSTRLLLQ